MTLTQTLISSLNGGTQFRTNKQLLESARRNKVLLSYLTASDYDPTIRKQQEKKLSEIVQVALSISNALSGLDYALIKFVKPVRYVPADIDILVSPAHLRAATKVLQELGFMQIVQESCCVTFKGSQTVDLYINPAFADVPYMAGIKLLNHCQTIWIDGTMVRKLTTEAEAVLAAAHAIYKEHIFTLNDFLTITKWVNKNSLDIANETKTVEALQTSLAICDLVIKGERDLPCKLRLPEIIGFLGIKIAKDSQTRSSFLKRLAYPIDKKLLVDMRSRILRSTY